MRQPSGPAIPLEQQRSTSSRTMTRQICLLVLLALGQPASGQAVSDPAPETGMSTVTVSAPGKLVTIPYLRLRKFSDQFRDPGPPPHHVDARMTLALGRGDADFNLSYSDKAGVKQLVVVNKYGVVELPDLDPALAKTAMLTARAPDDAKGAIVSVLYLPRLRSKTQLTADEYVQFLSETDAAYKRVSWSARLLFAGRLSAKAEGIKFCFTDANAAVVIGERRIPVGESGCYAHRVDDVFLAQKPVIRFDGDLGHAQILFAK